MRAKCVLAVAAIVLASAVGGCVKPSRMINQDGRFQEALEPYPDEELDTWGCLAGRMDVVQVGVEMGREGDVPVKAIVVDGYTEMPDDTDVVVALRPMGTRLYKTWADVVARDHRFRAVLGPFREDQLPQGTYVVEVMWLTHRQHPRVKAQADVQDANMRHRGRNMDMDHRASKIVRVPVAVLPPEPEPAAEGAPAGEHPSGEHPKGEHPAGEHPSGDHPKGEHPAGEHPSGDHPHGEHPTGGGK